ncbi:hypothetical protein F0U62_31890 [Cystobacter fuscus]|uniref:hypothetical protein n=1 Tax=Cystobacter fuscus TaxID=43 RepID=UPI002B317020|nr:hypothetical protein F0U62_31890 [Cystobacter fuscus]
MDAKLCFLLALLVGAGAACKRESDHPRVPDAGVPVVKEERPLPIPSNWGCAEKLAAWESRSKALAAGSPVQRLKAIQEIAASFGEDPEGCVADEISASVNNELKRLVWLEVDGKQYPASAVFSCTELREGTKCVGRVADDTAHLSEQPGVSLIPLTGKEQLSIGRSPDFRVDSFDVYSAQERALLDDPKATPIPVSQNGRVASLFVTEPTVLFVIARDRESETYRKFVWLLKKRK